jgi:hypothetical protein
VPPELRKLFDELERLHRGVVQAEMQALTEQVGKRMQALASRMGADPGPDWDKLLSEEAARFDTAVGAMLQDLRKAMEAKIGPVRHRSPKPPQRSLDIMVRRPPGKGRRKPPGPIPDAGGVPVKPDRPSGLSGGAAAEIEHD